MLLGMIAIIYICYKDIIDEKGGLKNIFTRKKQNA
jgi:hypothetical protein